MEGEAPVNPFGLDDHSLDSIKNDFAKRQRMASSRKDRLFAVFQQTRSLEETVGLQFLFAYMPLNDLADYDGSLFLSHVRRSLEIRERVPWGKQVPGNLFLHFVLPYRISNETIGDYRGYFYDALSSRIKGMTMQEAILEINHWCHEKATYISTDARTASPLTVIRTAHGRCGEESALLVAALRSLVIPARQCYTPRWAHIDDNHAWVEAWADGQWYFLGACEPEPELNQGWFAGPAKRAMLVNTRVLGVYQGPEETVQARDGFTEINLLPNYAPTRKLTVSVKDSNGKPVSGANVDFQVFNYGHFSTLTCLVTGEQGRVSLSTGFGDLLIYVSSESGWGYAKASPGTGDHVDIVLTNEAPEETVFELDMVAPPEVHLPEDKISEAQREENNRRLKEEDRIRSEYEATFITVSGAEELAHRLLLPTEAVCEIMENARGNSHEIAKFLEEAAPRYGKLAVKLLQSLPAKDMTDTTRAALFDHLEYSIPFKKEYQANDFTAYVMCPRVSLETLRPYRKFFQSEFSLEEQKRFRENPSILAAWVRENIKPVSDGLFRVCATPTGTFELRYADSKSRRVLFVAMARSFGIAARLAPADRRPQFLAGRGWVEAILESEGQIRCKGRAPTGTGRIRLVKKSGCEGDTEYYRNFTLARFEDNSYHVLHYRDLEANQLSEPLEVLPGSYLLTTGNRLADGTTLVMGTSFLVRANETVNVDMVLRSAEVQAREWGSICGQITLAALDGGTQAINQLLAKDGLVMAWIEPDREPSKHLIRELGELRSQFDERKANIRLCLGEEQLTTAFRPDAYQDLPKATAFAVDPGYRALELVMAGMTERLPRSLPLVIVVDSEKSIRYASAGYRLGTGVQILRALGSENVRKILQE